MGSRLKTVNLLYDASITFNVAVQHWKHSAMYAQSRVHIIQENSLFSPSTAMKSRPAYYTWVRIICEIWW